MDKTQLKHRIVGAVVLVALGVIFIPMILSTDSEFTISETNIPAKPAALEQLAEMKSPEPAKVQPAPVLDAEMVDEKTPAGPDAVTNAAGSEGTSAPAATQSGSKQTVTKSEPKPDTSAEVNKAAQTNARAWVVQVASFSERDKAMKLRDRLRKAKYPSFVESVAAKKSTLYRVRVGPVVEREHADNMQKKIAKDFKLPDALVMAYPG